MSFKNGILNTIIFFIIILIIPTFIYEYITRDPSIYFLPKKSIIIITAGIVIWYFHEYTDDEYNPYGDNVFFKSTNKNKIYNNIPYCQRTDVETYNKITKINTEKKLKELVESPKFMKMMEEKGEDAANWNWQIKEKLSGKKPLDESDIDSSDIENMSLNSDKD